MKTQSIIGQRIVAVRQSRVRTNAGVFVTVDCLELENGVRLVPTAYETEAEPIGDLVLVPKKK